MAATVVIPARYGSTRFPAKIVASRTGKPLVQHVVEQVRRCARVEQVIVAIDDSRIADALRPFGTSCVMTSRAHQSGTDRIAEVARGLDASIIVNVQGDEPEIEQEVVEGLIERLERTDEMMATAATPFPVGANPADPNLVKVVVALDGRAIYFSRAAIPFARDAAFSGDSSPPTQDATGPAAPSYNLHLGIYAYRREFLLEFASWAPTPLERIEKLEQLRALEHGRAIGVLKVRRATHGIDTPEQYDDFVRRFAARESNAGRSQG